MFHFSVGGNTGLQEPFTGFELFGGRSFFFPVRGYQSGARRGRYSWSTSAEYRFPLALLNEGIGLFPLHADRISGTVFFDAANAWDPALEADGFLNPHRETLTSVGVEVVFQLLTFFSIPVTVRTGFAHTLAADTGSVFYVRLGRSF